MSLYHFSVKQVSRGKGQTVVGSAAYISGQKLHNDYYEEIHDYTRKQGVIYDEIMLPDYVPDRFFDRQTLWNEVVFAEKGKRAQLAYSFNIALQNELTLEEKVKLKTGTKVRINRKSENKGKIEIEYYSQDDLEKILGYFK